jgi:hypothetical protein
VKKLKLGYIRIDDKTFNLRSISHTRYTLPFRENECYVVLLNGDSITINQPKYKVDAFILECVK